MRLFQLVAVPLMIVMLLLSARGLFQRARMLTALFWTLLWLSAVVAVIYPDDTTRIAQAVGIRRGADLLMYCSVLGFTGGFYAVSLRLRQLSREITLLTRELALLQAPQRPVASANDGSRDLHA